VRAAGGSSAAAVPAAVYLLFSGRLDRPDVEHRPPRGFDCEESARLAFVRIRLEPSSRSLWAELVAAPADGRPNTLCWFGTPTSRADHLVRAATALPLSFSRWRLHRAGWARRLGPPRPSLVAVAVPPRPQRDRGDRRDGRDQSPSARTAQGFRVDGPPPALCPVADRSRGSKRAMRPPVNRPAITATVNCNGATRNINRKEADMSTMRIPEPEQLLRPSEDRGRARLRKWVAMAGLGLAGVSGLALAVGANSTRTAPGPVPARSEPAVSSVPPHAPVVVAGCLADIECYGESQGIPNKPAPH